MILAALAGQELLPRPCDGELAFDATLDYRRTDDERAVDLAALQKVDEHAGDAAARGRPAAHSLVAGVAEVDSAVVADVLAYVVASPVFTPDVVYDRHVRLAREAHSFAPGSSLPLLPSIEPRTSANGELRRMRVVIRSTSHAG